MKVLKVIPGLSVAGAEQSFASTASAMSTSGVELHLAVLTDRHDLAPDLIDAGVTIHDLSKHRGRLRQLEALRRLVRRTRPDLVHASLWDAAVIAQPAARISNVPVLVTWAAVGKSADHTGGRTWKHRVVDISDVVLAQVCRTRFHAVTKGVATANAKQLRVPPQRVWIVERARPDVAPGSPDDVAATRAELGLDTNARVILAVGRHEAVKDHATLLRSAEILSERRPDIVVLVAGRDGAETARLTSAVRANPADVRLLGHRDDITELMDAADVFVSTSLSEGAAGGIIEAFRSSLPVVSTDVIGQRGILVDETNALLAPIGDAEAVAERVDLLLGDPPLQHRVAAAGRTTYEERFTLDRAVEATLTMYEQVVRSR